MVCRIILCSEQLVKTFVLFAIFPFFKAFLDTVTQMRLYIMLALVGNSTGFLSSRSAIPTRLSPTRGLPDSLNQENLHLHNVRRGFMAALYSSSAGAVQTYEGVQIGPPPDLPSLLLHNRIVYIGMPLVPAVTELILAELLYLNYESSDKPIYMYINSSGTTGPNGQQVGFETEAFAIADCMVSD